MRYIVVLLLAGLMISGCACRTAEMLNASLGKMNYEDAILTFGPPTHCAESGQSKVCVWSYNSGVTTFVPMGSAVMAVPARPKTARLRFTNDILTYWKLEGRWE